MFLKKENKVQLSVILRDEFEIIGMIDYKN